MNNLEFDDGLKRLAINGDENRIITINPTDIAVIKRYNEVIPQLDELSEKYKEIPQEKTVEAISELDKKAREFIDYIIGSPVSETVFGTANCLSYAGGQTIFENFLTAYMNYMTPAIKSEYEKSKKRIEKYTKHIK
nr:MAG TPA: hypothetical protein [Caudoviricetes sp.]